MIWCIGKNMISLWHGPSVEYPSGVLSAFAKTGGIFVAMKGGAPEDELHASKGH